MIYLVIGVPGSGKSWVTSQLTHESIVIPHDEYIKKDYARALYEADNINKPTIGELPFGISEIVEKLTKRGCDVTLVFIIEDAMTLIKRYGKREGRNIPYNHITRQKTYEVRAKQLKAFSGTSEEVLAHLRKILSKSSQVFSA